MWMKAPVYVFYTPFKNKYYLVVVCLNIKLKHIFEWERLFKKIPQRRIHNAGLYCSSTKPPTFMPRSLFTIFSDIFWSEQNWMSYGVSVFSYGTRTKFGPFILWKKGEDKFKLNLRHWKCHICFVKLICSELRSKLKLYM